MGYYPSEGPPPRIAVQTILYGSTLPNHASAWATKLRKRIESYFESNGANEPLVFEILSGAYRLVFHRRPQVQ